MLHIIIGLHWSGQESVGLETHNKPSDSLHWRPVLVTGNSQVIYEPNVGKYESNHRCYSSDNTDKLPWLSKQNLIISLKIFYSSGVKWINWFLFHIYNYSFLFSIAHVEFNGNLSLGVFVRFFLTFISPMGTPIALFWTPALGLKARVDLSITYIVVCVQWIPQIHLWCDTCWPLDGHHGRRAVLIHALVHNLSVVRFEWYLCKCSIKAVFRVITRREEVSQL